MHDTICMTSYELHMTLHPLFMISLHAMTSHPLYSCHHARIPIISSTGGGPLLKCTDYTTPTICVKWNPLHVWHHRNSIWHHTHSLWHNNTVFMMSRPLYSWQHTHSIWHYIHSSSDITVSMTRLFLCLWHHTQYIWHLTWFMNDNTTTVSNITLKVSV